MDDRVRALRRSLLTANDVQRLELLAQLEVLESELRTVLSRATGSQTPPPRVHLVLYRVLCERARHANELATEPRLALFEEAHDQALVAGSEEAAARALLLSAELLLAEGHVVRARDVLARARRDRTAPRTLPFLLQAAADAERMLGAHQNALDLLREAEAALPQGRAWLPLTWRLPGARGQILLELGLTDLAAGEIATEARLLQGVDPGDPTAGLDRIASCLHRGNLALAQGRWEDAIAVAEEALSDTTLVPDGSRWRAALTLLRGLAREGRIGPAETTNETAASAAQEDLRAALQHPELPGQERVAAEIALARLALFEGDSALAEELLRATRVSLETLRAAGEHATVRAEEADLATAEARLLLTRAQESGTPPAAGTLEETLARLEATIRARLALWSEAPLRAGGLGFLERVPHRVWFATHADLCLLDERAETTERIFALLLEAQCVGSAVRARGGWSGTPEEVRRRLLGARHGLLVFLPGRPRSHVLAIARDTIQHAALAEERVLLAAVLEHERSLGALRRNASTDPEWEADVDRERAAARRLAELLFPPSIAETLAGWDAVDLVGADLLGGPSVELLPCGAAPYAGHAKALARVPSLPLAMLQTSPVPFELDQDGGADFVLLTAPLVATKIEERWPEAVELPLSDLARARLTAPFASERVRVLSGSDANRSALAPDARAGVRVLQLLVHGVQDHERERPATLVLSAKPQDTAEQAADDGLFGCDDVVAGRGPDLLLLTSCGSAVGPGRRGDGSAGSLGGAWLAAGASAILHSRHDLDYAVTVELSARMLKGVAEGSSPAEALRAARASAFLDGVIPHPAQDGGLHLIGLAHTPLFSARTGAGLASPWPLGLGLGLLLVGTALLVRSRMRRGAASGT